MDNHFDYYFKNVDIKSRFFISLRNKTTIYFYCGKKRNGCDGYIKYSIEERKMVLNKTKF